MPDHSYVPLLLLYTNSRESIDGATRFQKLVFLAQQEGGLEDTYTFHAEKYGPYSYDLAQEIEAFVDMGLIERDTVRNEVGNKKQVFSLTTKGIQVVRKVSHKDAWEPVLEVLTGIKQTYNEDPLQELLRYVYRRYDTYTTESELDLDRLFDPDSRSQFLDVSEEEPDFLASPPSKAIEQNSSADELFSIE